MSSSTITSKHQITIPSEMRRALNLRKGDRLSFQSAGDGAWVVRKIALSKSDGAAKGYLPPDSLPLDDAMIREAVGKGVLASFHRRQP